MKIANYYMVSQNVLNGALLSSDSIIDTKNRATIPNIVTYKEKP